jgi:hypothetical protein
MVTVLTGAADDPESCLSSAFGLTRQTSDLTPFFLGATFLSSSNASV